MRDDLPLASKMGMGRYGNILENQVCINQDVHQGDILVSEKCDHVQYTYNTSLVISNCQRFLAEWVVMLKLAARNELGLDI